MKSFNSLCVNQEKDRQTIEQSFEMLLKFVQELDTEEKRAVQEGLDEESLAIFDLLRKPDLTKREIKRVKEIAVDLLKTLKEEKLRIDHWREKEATRDAVQQAIHDFLYQDSNGLPLGSYTEIEVSAKATDVFRHVYRVYPSLPSQFFVVPN